MINKERLVAITDGIIAVAATVMVLRLDIPDMASLAAFRERAPILVAYIISYMQIFLAWHEHHDSFIHAERINHRIFLMNTLWLFLITMLPFVTGVLGKSPNHRPTILLYLAVLVLQICVQTQAKKSDTPKSCLLAFLAYKCQKEELSTNWNENKPQFTAFFS